MIAFATILDPERQGTAIEIGVGTQDYYFVDFVKSGFPTLAVEPAPADTLVRTCNAVNVTLEIAAIAEEDGEVTLYLGEYQGQRNVNLNSLNVDWWGVNPQTKSPRMATPASIKVPALTLRSLLQKHQIDRISILKLDTEGSEFGIISGLREIPPQALPSLVQFEYGGGGDRQSQQGGWNPKYFNSTLDCLNVLKSLGYEWLVLIDWHLPIARSFRIADIDNFADIFHPLSHVGNAIVCKEGQLERQIDLPSLCQPYVDYPVHFAKSLINFASEERVHSFQYILPYVILNQYKIKRRPLRVLEYGPGCNSQQFINSLVCQQLVSVEDNLDWYRKFYPVLQSAKNIEIDYHLVEVKSAEGQAYQGGHCWTEVEILEYVEYPLKYGDGYFDIIFVDSGDRQDRVTIQGRSYPGCPIRNLCLELAHRLLNENGVAIVHDVPGYDYMNVALAKAIASFKYSEGLAEFHTTILSDSLELTRFGNAIRKIYGIDSPQISSSVSPASSNSAPEMLDLARLLSENAIAARGIVHVGAHEGKEIDLYQQLGVQKVLFIEANPAVFQRLKFNLTGVKNAIAVNCAISNENGTVELHVTSMDQASSILPLKRVREYYPEIHETDRVTVQCKTLDSLLQELHLNPADFNILNIDIQGAELLALQGAKNLLNYIDAINTEINYEELYAGGALLDKIDEYLGEYDFDRIAIATPYHPSWGDAFYVKKATIAMSTLGSNGRFANQIFQYAFLKFYAKEHNLRIETSEWIGEYLFGHRDRRFSKRLPEVMDSSHSIEDSRILQAKEPFKNVDIRGYFQFNTRYYARYKDYFCSLFQPLPEIERQLKPARDRLRSRGKTIVGLHLRLKDYGFSYFFIAPVIWYKDWLRSLWSTLEEPVLLIASDEIDKVTPYFAEYNPVTAKELGAELPQADFYPDFYLLSQCDILAISNSSFSFVASMLNPHGKLFVRPHLLSQKLIPYDPWNSNPILRDAKVAKKYEPACLNPLRQQISARWLSVNRDRLEITYSSGVGTDRRILLNKGVKNEPLTDDDRAFVERLNANIASGLDAPMALQSFLAITLYRDAYQLPLRYDGATIPKWLLVDFIEFLLSEPSTFQEPGEPDRYFHYANRLVDYLHVHIWENPDSPLWRYIGECFSKYHNFRALLSSEKNPKTILEKRSHILEFMLKQLGQQIDWTFPQRSPNRTKIRVGILQSNFFAAKETVVTLAAFEHLDRDKFEIVLYALEVNGEPLEEYCRSRVDRLVQLPKTLPAQVEKIRSDRLDLLGIGSEISSNISAIALLALHRLAPIQFTGAWVSATTGMRHIDCYIAGSLMAASSSFSDYFCEQVVVLEGSGLCFARPQETIEMTSQRDRQQWGATENAVVFISGANVRKIVPQIRETWAKILAAVPNSILVLVPYGAMGANFYRSSPYYNPMQVTLEKYGVAKNRLVVIDRLESLGDLQACLRQADIYLDAYPDTGDLSVLDPLKLGLPVVVREGTVPQSRRSPALLRELKLSEFVTDSESAYIQLAVSLASNLQQRQFYRQRIREQFQGTPAFLDSRAYSAKMGALWETLFRRFVGELQQR